MSSVKIVSTGAYIPSRRIPSTEFDSQFGLKPGTVEQMTGIAARYYANDRETAPYMGAKALATALERAGLRAEDLDAIVAVSGSPAQLVPCTASLILGELGTSRPIATFDINSTCLSFVVGVDTVGPLVAAGRFERVALVATEAGSSCLSPYEVESAALIADAAVALIIERTPEGEASKVLASGFETHPEGVDHCHTHGGTSRPRPGVRGTEPRDMYFTMRGPQVFKLASKVFPPFLKGFLDDAGYTTRDFDLVVPHQASGFAVALMLRRLELPTDKSFVYLKDYGNTIAASIPLGLHFAIESDRLHRGDKVLCVGTGAGLSVGALAFLY